MATSKNCSVWTKRLLIHNLIGIVYLTFFGRAEPGGTQNRTALDWGWPLVFNTTKQRKQRGQEARGSLYLQRLLWSLFSKLNHHIPCVSGGCCLQSCQTLAREYKPPQFHCPARTTKVTPPPPLPHALTMSNSSRSIIPRDYGVDRPPPDLDQRLLQMDIGT